LRTDELVLVLMSFYLLNAAVFFDLIEVQQIRATNLFIIGIGSLETTIAVVAKIEVLMLLSLLGFVLEIWDYTFLESSCSVNTMSA